MPTPQARSSARLSMFKPTVDTEENKESRTNKGWVGRREKRGALVHQKRTDAHHHERQKVLEPALASHHEESHELESLDSFHKRMEADRYELEEGMAAAQQLVPPALPDDSWDSEENGEESSNSIHTQDMFDYESSEEEE